MPSDEAIRLSHDPNPDFYEVDWDSIDTLDEVIALLSGMDLRVSSNHDRFEDLKPHLKPVDDNQS